MNDETELYTTTDFYTTAILISKKFQVIKLTTQGNWNHIKRFHFSDSPELREIVLLYMNRQLDGNLRDFRDAIEVVKDLVHSN